MNAPSSGPGFVVAGGGTGGHLFPGLAVAGRLRERVPGATVTFVGTERGIEARLAPALGWPVEFVPARGLVGKSLGARISGSVEMARGLVAAHRLLGRLAPRAVLGVGGYAAAPVVAAAWARRIPTVLHEQNAVPGWTNRVLAPFAKSVALSFEGTASRLRARHRVVTGNPVRPEFFRVPPPAPVDGRLRVLVVGGSQGARILNETVPGAFAHSLLGDHRVEVVHQTGERDRDAVVARYRDLGRPNVSAEVLPFVDDLAARYAWADLLIARAGATTVFELAAAGRPSILVPFAAAASAHQDANAEALAAAGAAVVVPEREASADRIAQELAPFAYDPPKIVRAGAAAATLARPDAADRVADLVLAAAGLLGSTEREAA